MKYKWMWCELCGHATVICQCGNNCCNGGYGLNGECPDCPNAYAYQDEAMHNGTMPLTPEECDGVIINAIDRLGN